MWKSTVLLSVLILLVACSDDQPSPPPPGEGGHREFDQPPEPEEVFPEVWSMNSPEGTSYEFKTNCFSPTGGYDTLEECPLWDLTDVEVSAPDGRVFALEKDFNINEYSGEETRRWVLYGPSGGELPPPGDYTFRYLKAGTVVDEQIVSYQPEVVGYPTGIAWTWDGDDLHVAWQPASGMASGMWYKVLIFPGDGSVLSDTFEWDADSAALPDLPPWEGTSATLNVSAYFSGGYAPSEYLPIEWGR